MDPGQVRDATRNGARHDKVTWNWTRKYPRIRRGSGTVASAGVDSDMVEDEVLGWRKGIPGTEVVPVLYAGVVYNSYSENK